MTIIETFTYFDTTSVVRHQMPKPGQVPGHLTLECSPYSLHGRNGAPTQQSGVRGPPAYQVGDGPVIYERPQDRASSSSWKGLIGYESWDDAFRGSERGDPPVAEESTYESKASSSGANWSSWNSQT